MILIPTPDMTIMEWADRMSLLVTFKTAFTRLDNPEMWQEWAAGLFTDANLAVQNTPDPYNFDDWREYAERLFYTAEFNG